MIELQRQEATSPGPNTDFFVLAKLSTDALPVIFEKIVLNKKWCYQVLTGLVLE